METIITVLAVWCAFSIACAFVCIAICRINGMVGHIDE